MQLYESLIDKLDTFIRKYYFNQLLKGTLLFLIVGLLLFFIISLSEYYLYLPVAVKLPLAVLLALLGIWGLGKYVIIPVLQMQKIGSRISYKQAAEIIGAHFSHVNDKILNVIQLQEQNNTQQADWSLLEASITQKTEQLITVPFVNAVNLQQNRKYLPWFLGLLLLIGAFTFIIPNLFRDSAKRLLQPTTAFTPPAPFQFRLHAQALKATLWQPHDITVSLQGDKLPESIYINLDGEHLLMQKIAENTYKYTISKVNKAHRFYFTAVGYTSDKYKLSVDLLPIIDQIEVDINYPRHIGKPAEKLNVFSDLQVPEGTIIAWKIKTQHTQNISVLMDSTQVLQTQENNQVWAWEKQVVRQSSFQVLIKGKQNNAADTFRYTIAVIKDNAPVLEIQTKRDTIIGNQMVFVGVVSDDYGIQNLNFNYEILDNKNKVLQHKTIKLPIQSTLTAQINHYFDAGALNIDPKQNVRMYIQACDNDIINGGKCVRSAYVYLNDKNSNEAENQENALEKNADKLQETLQASQQKQKAIQKDFQELKSKMLDANTMNWQQKQQIEEMISQQELLKKQMEAVRKRLEEQQRQTDKMELSESLEEKQKAVKKQLDQIINKELQEQLQKLQELQQQRNPQDAFEKMQEMEQQNKLSQMNMERVQELIKQLELQLSMELLAEKIDEFVAKEQDILDKTEAGDLSEANKQEQNQIKQDFEKMMQESLQDLKAKEKQAEKSNEASQEAASDAQEASESMDKSSEELGKKNQSGAQHNQKDAVKKMQQMSQKLKDGAGGMDMEQVDIDIKATRQLLSNLLRFSFDQEKLIEKVRNTQVYSNNFVTINKEQARLAQNAKMIKDSLFSLSKRVFQIASSVNKEATELEMNLNNSLQYLQDKNTSTAQVSQQYAMTNANRLALILNELLENLISDMQASGDQSGSSGSSPGSKQAKGKGNSGEQGTGDQLKDIITKQQQLGQGMQQGQGKQGKGTNGQQGQGDGKNGQGEQGAGSQGQSGEGNSGGNGGEAGSESEYGDAKELARMAREQAQLRKQLNQLNSILNSKGIKGLGKDLTELQSLMDKNETDLVNKRLTRELLLRQQEIMTKLLEAEKAVREQEQDDKRQGNTAKAVERPIPPDLKDFIKEQQELFEQYKTDAPILKPYYKNINDKYLQKVK